jgi:hypothetical protein
MAKEIRDRVIKPAHLGLDGGRVVLPGPRRFKFNLTNLGLGRKPNELCVFRY